MSENNPVELIANTTGTALSAAFTKPANSNLTIYSSGTIAGAETIKLQVKSPAGTYSDIKYATGAEAGTVIQLSATVNSFDVVGNGTFRLSKSSTSAAAGAFYYSYGGA